MLPPAERDALIRQHADYARALTLEIARTLPRFVSREELVAVGTEGLVEAASRFDPTRGVMFTTFAYYRIRGAVYDHVRRLANHDPYVRARVASEAAVDDLVEGALAGRPRAAGDGPAQAAEALAGVLETAARAFAVADCAEALLAESARPDTEAEAVRREAAGHVRRALATLPAKERTMIDAVYFEGRTIEEAGASLGLSKSWASRLHARALSLLRDAVGPLEG